MCMMSQRNLCAFFSGCMESTHSLIMLENVSTATIGNTKQSINIWL
jgi:hypothetical protein